MGRLGQMEVTGKGLALGYFLKGPLNEWKNQYVVRFSKDYDFFLLDYL